MGGRLEGRVLPLDGVGAGWRAARQTEGVECGVLMVLPLDGVGAGWRAASQTEGVECGVLRALPLDGVDARWRADRQTERQTEGVESGVLSITPSRRRCEVVGRQTDRQRVWGAEGITP